MKRNQAVMAANSSDGDLPKYDVSSDFTGIPERIRHIFKKNKISDASSLLFMSLEEFTMITGLSEEEAISTRKTVSRNILGTGSDNLFLPLSLKSRERRLSFGCQVLNQISKGGIPTKGLIEICGESSSGKTQLCLQLSLTAQLQENRGGLNGSVVYICTEDRFPIKRFEQMKEAFHKNSSFEVDRDFSDNLYILHIGEFEPLMTCITNTLPSVIRSKHVKLVVVDSVAALFRSDYTFEQSIQRAQDIQRLGYSLISLSKTLNITVVCVNQITDAVEDNILKPFPGSTTIPSLGLAWANLVSTRIFLSRTSAQYSENYSAGSSVTSACVRKIKFVYSSSLASEGYFVVILEGVCGILEKDLLNFKSS